MRTTTCVTRPAAHSWGRGIGSIGNSAFPVGSLSNWQVIALQKLARLSSLRPNWDSYGSPPVSDWVLTVAAELVSKTTFENAPTPAIIPIKGGGVQLEWESGGRELEVEVHPDLTVELLTADDDEQIEEFSVRYLAPSSLESLLSWLGGR